jgi:hypothetical protein
LIGDLGTIAPNITEGMQLGGGAGLGSMLESGGSNMGWLDTAKGFMNDYGGLIGSGLDMVGDYYGAKKSADAMKDAADAQAAAMLQAQRESQAYQEAKNRQATGLLYPYLQQFGGQDVRDEMANFGTSGLGGQLTGQMADLANRGLNLDYKADPAYQWREKQQEEAINRQLAGRGMYDSRYGMDVLADAGMNLSGQEADKQYMRAVDDYNRQYGDLTNRYGLGYQDLLNRFGTGTSMANSLAGMYTGLGSTVGNQILNTGINSASSSALLNSQAGQTMGNMYSGLGNTLSGAIEDWQFQPYMDKMMDMMTTQQPRITFG